MEKSLLESRRDLILSAEKGYPILMAGSIFMFVMIFVPLLFPMEIVHLIWVIGMGSIFPLGLLLAKLLKVDVISKGNPLSTVGGLVGGSQIFYIPLYILLYQIGPEWIPFAVGLLGGSHFLLYYWIYDSRGYLFLTIATSVFAAIFGAVFIEQAYTIVPIGIFIIYTLTVFLLKREMKNESGSSGVLKNESV